MCLSMQRAIAIGLKAQHDHKHSIQETSARRSKLTMAAQAMLPNLSPLPTGSDESDQLEQEKDAKRPRLTSTTPKSNRGREPFEYDRLMGAPSVGSTSGEERNGEQTDPETPNRESLPTHFRDLTLVLVLWRVRGSWKR